MKLLLDLGNSYLKWAWLPATALSETARLPLHAITDGSLDTAWQNQPAPAHLWLASVAPQAAQQTLLECITRHWPETEVHLVHSEQQAAGVHNSYQQPESLGIDRWLALVAARQITPKACCIIDAGTAITVDAMDQSGRHQGGMILPGLTLMQQSLANTSTALNTQAQSTDYGWLATNTHSAIESGTLYCLSASLNQLIADLTEQLGTAPQIFLCGGDAEHLLPLLNTTVSLRPNLVLEGLAWYAQQR